MADIIRAIEDADEVPSAAAILERAPNTRDLTQDLRDSLHSTIENNLSTITLDSLGADQRAKGYQPQAKKPERKGIFKPVSPQSLRPNAPNSAFLHWHKPGPRPAKCPTSG